MFGKKTIKNCCILLLCIVMVVLCACSQGSQTDASTPETAVTTSSAPAADVSITVGLRENAKIGDFKSNAFTKYLCSSGCRLEQELYSSDTEDNEGQIKNMVTVGAVLPDLLFDVLCDAETIVMIGQAGAICDLQGFLYDDESHQNPSVRAKPFWDYLHEEFSNKEITNLLSDCSDQKSGAIYALPLVMPGETEIRYLILTNDCANKEAAFDVLMKTYETEGVELLSCWLAPFSGPSNTADAKNVPLALLEDYLLNQYYSNGIFSAQYGQLLYRCAPDYRFEARSFRESYSAGEETKLIDSLKEDPEWKEEYLDSFFFVWVKGRVIQNPDVQFMLSEDKTILSCILGVNDSSVRLLSDINVCHEFETFASIFMARGY